MKKMLLLVLGIIFINVSIFGDWIDDMTYDKQSKEMSKKLTKIGSEESEVVFTRPNDTNGLKAMEVIYKNGGRNGSVKVYHVNGNLFIDGNYKNDQRDGKWMFYTEENILKFIENYKNGMLNGVKKEFYEDGKTLLLLTNYKNNKKEGEKIKYYKAGKGIETITNYKNDKEDGEIKDFYKDGKKYGLGFYKNGKLEKQDTYYPNGNLFMKRYRLGKNEEKVIYYYETGEEFLKGFIYKDKPAKEWKAFDKKGDILSEGEGTKVIADVQYIYMENQKKNLKYNEGI